MSMNRNRKEHPSYGVLGFHRVSSCGSTTLFGSSIKHSNTIMLTLKTASMERGLNSDWYYGGHELFRVEMSQTQFAELITSMNIGDGVPVTIRSIQGETVPPCPFESKADLHRAEFRDELKETYESTRELLDKTRELFSTKKTLTKKDKDEILGLITSISNNIGTNMDFQMKRFQEQMAKTVTEAKGEIEAFTTNTLLQIGRDGLVERRNNADALPAVEIPQIEAE